VRQNHDERTPARRQDLRADFHIGEGSHLRERPKEVR
jgi:hypothetical protein